MSCDDLCTTCTDLPTSYQDLITSDKSFVRVSYDQGKGKSYIVHLYWEISSNLYIKMVIIPRTMTVIEKFQILSLAGLTKYKLTIHSYNTYQYKKKKKLWHEIELYACNFTGKSGAWNDWNYISTVEIVGQYIMRKTYGKREIMLDSYWL